MSSNFNKLYIDGLLTQWVFHRVQEHPKRSSDKEVMTFRSWRSHLVTPSRADLNWPRCSDLSELGLTPTVLPRIMNGILNQWDFHRVQELPKRTSDEDVMAIQSWRTQPENPVRRTSRGLLFSVIFGYNLSLSCINYIWVDSRLKGLSIESKNTQNGL